MGCCSPFSAVTTRLTADPHQHVNFTAGMVLGVDDYSQEFAYHSERDKWIVRDFLGYGTLSGLAVSLEDDGDTGPLVKVSAGSAAAPSGQLICVGRDQCGSLNPWLARSETADKLRLLLGADATQATLHLFLTLCYVDCAVAEVPIPGEPCRSDENLMAPSRIADDYCIDFRFDPPPMSEAKAIETLTAFLETPSVLPGNPNSPNDYARAVHMAEVQLLLAFGLTDPESEPAPAADLGTIQLHPTMRARFGFAVRRLYATRIRPFVSAQRCFSDAVPANDCVLLGRLTVPVVRPGANWVVESPPAGKVELDESDRPVLISVSAAQSRAGASIANFEVGRKIAFMTGSGPAPIVSGLVIVRSADPAVVGLPAPSSANLGSELTVKAADTGLVTVAAPVRGPVTIDGVKTLEVPARGAVSLVSDGDQTWHISGRVQ
jgi:hypothetical protein